MNNLAIIQILFVHVPHLYRVICLLTKGSEERKTVTLVFTATDAYLAWQKQNPDIPYISLSPTGTILLTDVIVAHDILHGIFPLPGDEFHKKKLLRILNEQPPEPHKPTPNQGANLKPSFVRVFLILNRGEVFLKYYEL